VRGVEAGEDLRTGLPSGAHHHPAPDLSAYNSTESAVILDSVLPTTFAISGNWRGAPGFDNLFHACAAEAACNAAPSASRRNLHLTGQ
jgi:hypothetical protein